MLVIIKMTSRVKKPFVIDSSSQRSRMQVYEPIADEHLYNFFCSPVVRKTMLRGGLVTRKGEVIRHSANPRAPRLVLPPLALIPAPPPKSTLDPKHTATSTGRLNIPKDSESATHRMGRKAESTSNLTRTREGKVHESTGKRPWEAGSLKPLSHEEYEKLLQRFCEGVEEAKKPAAEAKLERKKSEDLAKQQLREEARKLDLPIKPKEQPMEAKKPKKPEPKAEAKKPDLKEQEDKKPAEPPAKPVEAKAPVTQPKRSFSPIIEEKHEPPATPPKPEAETTPTHPTLPQVPPKTPPSNCLAEQSHPNQELPAPGLTEEPKETHQTPIVPAPPHVEKSPALIPHEEHKEPEAPAAPHEGNLDPETLTETAHQAASQESAPHVEPKAEGSEVPKENEPPHYNAEVPVVPLA